VTISTAYAIRIQCLRKALLLRAVGYGGMIALSFTLLGQVWPVAYAWLWLALALGAGGYQFWFTWGNLYDNRRNDESPLYPVLGWANEVTLLRGALFALLAGFWAAPARGGVVAWAPGVLYLTAASLDFLDGYLARITAMESRLGARLDMEWDSLGFLIAAVVGVFSGQIQAAYLLLGLARFAFVYGINRRKRAGLPVYDLDESMIRRALAGAQMGFLGVALLPVFSGVVTQAASLVFMIPSLAHFWRDWLWVSGRIGQTEPKPAWWGVPAVRFWLPLCLRGVLAALVGVILWRELGTAVPNGIVLAAGTLALPALVVGAAGRMTALGVMLLAGLVLRDHPDVVIYWLSLLTGFGVLIGGTGAYSLWTPENWLINHRAGEREGQGAPLKTHSKKTVS